MRVARQVRGECSVVGHADQGCAAQNDNCFPGRNIAGLLHRRIAVCSHRCFLET